MSRWNVISRLYLKLCQAETGLETKTSNLLRFLLRCGTRPYRDSISIVIACKSSLLSITPPEAPNLNCYIFSPRLKINFESCENRICMCVCVYGSVFAQSTLNWNLRGVGSGRGLLICILKVLVFWKYQKLSLCWGNFSRHESFLVTWQGKPGNPSFLRTGLQKRQT